MLTPQFSLPAPRSDFLRGVVLKVNTTQNGQVPLFTFRVRFEGSKTGSLDGPGIHDNVLMLQPGFQKPTRQDPGPGGLVYLPEIGSVVACIWDGRNWVIVGFYTGPAQTPETAADTEKRVAGYNPGIEAAVTRTMGAANTLADWGFGMAPGDALMSKGTAKVKVTDFGAVIGGNSFAGTWYKADGEVLDRFLKRHVRGPGYWRRMDSYLGPSEMLAVMASVHAEGIAPPSAYQVTHEIFETSPWAALASPYWLASRGHVSQSALGDGRASVVGALTDLMVQQDRVRKTYVVKHDALVQPLIPTVAPVAVVPELAATGAVLYDHQVGPDGSFRIWSGNKGLAPGTPTPENFKLIPEFVLAYDSASQTFILTVGPTAATPTVAVEANGVTGAATIRAATSATLKCAPATDGPALSSVECTPAGVRITGAALVLDVGGLSFARPDVSAALNGASMVGAGLMEARDVRSGAVGLATHVHAGVKSGPDTSSPGLG